MEDMIDTSQEYYETNNEEETERIPSEDIHVTDDRRDVSFRDVLVFQLILCVILILALVIMKVINSQLSYAVASEFKNQVSKSFDYKGEIQKIVSSILGAFNAKV